ncbi:hypothetical protein L3X38_011096 [Prunus dulcis]|uniref:Uncharacterized protein n=1 Tax=Prunus dulcis TaxID=3755 RepID=A0AAD4WGQ7_PRUDU|nr:hypothetical protein L3X38_011096 [Prunus dulcis]
MRCKLSPLYQQSDASQPTLTSDKMGSGLVPYTFNRKKSELKIVRFIIKDEHPFRLIEGSRFKEIMLEVQSRLKVPSRKKVAEGVYKGCAPPQSSSSRMIELREQELGGEESAGPHSNKCPAKGVLREV